MTDQNTAYELLVAQFLQGMLRYDGFDTLRVEHDVTLTGRSGATHQIDVFWEFKAAGTIYRTCVECKNYTHPVKKSHVASFAAILTDIGNANGIIATTSSFQEGARQLAEANHIRLVLVNHLLRTIHITSHPITKHFSNICLHFNQESIHEALKANNLTEFAARYEMTGTDHLLTPEGLPAETFNAVINANAKQEGHNTARLADRHLMVRGLGLVRLDSITFDATTVRLPPFETIIESQDTAKAVIEDVIEKNVHYLHLDGSVST